MTVVSDIANQLASMKGVAGTGNVLETTINKLENFFRTLEPGDIVRSDPPLARAAPIAYDLWYLKTHQNFMAKYYAGEEGFNGDYYKYEPYMSENLKFLELLTGLKPLKALKNLVSQLQGTQPNYQPFWETLHLEWKNDGVYWINTLAFELWNEKQNPQYPSVGSTGYKTAPNNYAGYIAFPVGQLGVMEVISLMQETKLSGYIFSGGESPSAGGYNPQPPAEIQNKDKPSLQDTPGMFPDTKDINGNPLTGQNFCYGQHIIESTYLSKDDNVELFSAKIKDYGEDVEPKLWMRYWIKKDSVLPVPGEFIGILCRPVVAPPHVWWFQESSPFLYSGNWVEITGFTSGIITKKTLEKDRDDGHNKNVGDLYFIKLQGCEVAILSTDFFTYKVGERVAVVKIDEVVDKPKEKSFVWLKQHTFTVLNKLGILDNYVIVPITFFKSPKL